MALKLKNVRAGYGSENIIDIIVIIENGKIIDDGSPDEICNRDTLKNNFGVGVTRQNDNKALFAYHLIK